MNNAFTISAVSKFSVTELREELRRSNFKASGNKEDLVKRICEHNLDVHLLSSKSTNNESLMGNHKAMKLFLANKSLSNMLVTELREALQYWNLKKDGKKVELVKRLFLHLSQVAVSSQSISNIPTSPDKVTVLMVAEKPIMAQQISKMFPNRSNIKIRKNINNYKIHEFCGEFMGRAALFKMISTFGHIMKTEFLSEYQNWHSHDPVQLFTCPVEKIECNPSAKILKFLAEEAKGCDFAILWLDCDLEGENICFEVIDAIKKSMKKLKENIYDQIFRAHFSSLNDVEDAMKNLTRSNKNQALAVDVKKELDLRIGVAFSRFQTIYFRKRNRDRDVKLVSFGPCQTPTLAFCVEQHEKVEMFNSKTNYSLNCKALLNGIVLDLVYAGGEFQSKEECSQKLEQIKVKNKAKLKECKSKVYTLNQPKPLNTVELLKAASSKLNFSPSKTMFLSQNLYQKGLISYPRTETTLYPKNLSLKNLISSVVSDKQLIRWSNGKVSHNDFINKDDNVFQTRKGEDKGDHPPIYPILPIENSLNDEETQLFDYICQNFVASVLGPCKYETLTLLFSLEKDEVFKTEVKRVIDPGFTCVMTDQCVTPNKNKILENYNVGSIVTIENITLTKKKTTSPTHLTETQLISKMEHYAIGTDASISTHIENIMKSYVKLEKGRRLVPTSLGIALIKAYRKLDPELIKPTVRSDVERKLAQIARGEAEFAVVKNEILKLYEKKYIAFSKNFNKVEDLFQDCFPPRVDFKVKKSMIPTECRKNASKKRKSDNHYGIKNYKMFCQRSNIT